MKITNAQKRKAISPVIATVILIAITLIAAIAIAGFVFGLFGSFTSTAQVLVSSASCAATAPPVVCTLTLSNSGTANTAVVASTFTLTFGGVKYVGSCSTPVPVITAGAAAAATCSVSPSPAVTPVSGEQFTGSLGLSNGGVVSFSGTF
jgi:flagellin-like protein